jgi:hypothetical protein
MIRRHSTRLSQAHDEEPEEDQGHRTASHDYPELGSVLADRPDPGGIITVIGMRRQGEAYAQGHDERDEDYNGGEGGTGTYWAEPAEQGWVHENIGPQEEAPPPLYDPDMLPPAMARLAAIEEAQAFFGLRHHATTINGTQVDDAGDAPQHGTVPRAGDPDAYDGASHEGEGDDKWDDPLPWGSKDDENAATVGMYPEGISSGSGPGISVGPFTAGGAREFTGALTPDQEAEMRAHLRSDHASLPGRLADQGIDFHAPEAQRGVGLAEVHAWDHAQGTAGHDHGPEHDYAPYWDEHPGAGHYHEFTGSRREARVPWTGKERGQLHRWQEEPTATWGDFVPSSEFPLLGPGEHVSHEDDGNGIGAVEGSGDAQWEAHLRYGHGWDDARVERARAEGGLRSIHDAVHAFGLPDHRHAGGPEDARDEARETSVDNMFGPAYPRRAPQQVPLARPELGGSSRNDPATAIFSSETAEPPKPHEYYRQFDLPRFKRMMSALNVHVRIDGKELHGHDDDQDGPEAPQHEHDDPDNSLDNSPDNSPDKNSPEITSGQASQGGLPDIQPGAGKVPGGPGLSPDDPGHPDNWPQAGADVTERNRAYTQGSGDGKVTRNGTPAAFSPDDGDDQDGEDPNDTGEDDEDTPFSKDGALAMFTAAAGNRDFRFEFTAAWNDVVAKARRIRAEGHVRIVHASAGMVVGEVRGDHDTYESGIQRPVGKRTAIQHWACGCPWASFHQDKTAGTRYAGRPCSHVMALQFEAAARGMFGRRFDADPEVPAWSPPSVVVKSLPPYQGDPHAGRWHEEWRAPLARQGAYRGTARWHAPAESAAADLLRAGEEPGTVGALCLLAGMRAVADQANAPWGSDNVTQHPPQKPYGATSPPNRDQDPGSYGPLAAPDPENWGGIQEDSAYQMPLGNTAAHQVLVPGAPHPQPGDLHWPDVNGWQAEDQGTFGYTDHANTAGPSTAMNPRDPNGIRMEEARRATGSGTPFPYHGTVPQLDGALAELRDHPEPALPEVTADEPGPGTLRASGAADGTIGGTDAGTGQGQGAPLDEAALGEFGAAVRASFRQKFGGTPMGDLGRETSPQAQQPSPVGQSPGLGSGDDYLSPDDTSIQTVGNQQWSGGGADSDEVDVPAGQPQGGIDDIVASFQRSAASKTYAGGPGPDSGDGDIAVAARQYLAKTAEVLPRAEADELIREGAGHRARNLDLLRLEGTHYEDEDDELAKRGLSLDDYDDDVMFA